MALHSELPIYKVAYDLLQHVAQITRNIPRDFKQSIGGKLRDECVDLTVLVFRAQMARGAAKDPHKSLFNQPANRGLPIGNLSSQFFANVFLDVLDQHAKHRLRARHYVRYVDDIVILHDSAQWLNAALADITAFLPARLNAHLNPTKTILQPIARGIDFAGHVIKPWRRTLRRRTFNEALTRLRTMPTEDLYEAANSYLGLLRQATHSHHDRARLANVLRRRGFSVDRALTKTYRRPA